MDTFYFEMLVAYSKNYGIGINREIPWRIPEDLKRFKKITEHNVVIMGKNTFLSIPDKHKPLPNRVNIILTKNPTQACFDSYRHTPDVFVTRFESLQDILQSITDKRLFVIGGRQIYDLFLPYIQLIHATCVYKNFSNSDVFLDMDSIRKLFIEQKSTCYIWSPDEECTYKYITFIRILLPSDIKST